MNQKTLFKLERLCICIHSDAKAKVGFDILGDGIYYRTEVLKNILA